MSSSMTKMERPLNPAATAIACSTTPGSGKQGPASFGFRLSSQHMGVDLNKELEWLKERSKDDKRLKEKFPKIDGEPTWLLRHIEVLQEEYAKNGWEYEIEIPAECQHRLHPSIIGSYLIFTREKKGRKGKVTKEYIPVPLSKGASWEFWKPVDDDARPPTAGRLAYLPPLGPGESSIGTGLLDHDLDRYLNAGDDEEDFKEYTIDGFGVLPEDRPRRRVISNSSSGSGSGGKVSPYSGSSFDTAPTSTQSRSRSRSLSIMGSSANYAPDRALRSIRKASENSFPSNSTNNSSSSRNGRISNGMPVPGSIRKAKYDYRSDSEDPEDDSDDHNEDEDEEEQEKFSHTAKPIYGKKGRSQVIQDSDSEEEEEEGEDYPVYNPKSIRAKRGLSGVIDVFDDEDDGLPPPKLRHRKKGHFGAVVEISDEDDESVSSEPARKPKTKPIHGKKARQEVVEILEPDNEAGSDEDEDEFEGDDESQDEDDGENMLEDDEWFDKSGYCKFCDLHQHECDCIREDDDYPMDREENDDDYKN